jgi:hypothetical protein
MKQNAFSFTFSLAFCLSVCSGPQIAPSGQEIIAVFAPPLSCCVSFAARHLPLAYFHA